MPTTETNVRNLRINRLTNEQYETAVKSDTELYLTPDTTDADIASAIAAHNSDTTSHSNKQDKLTTQTAYSAKGSATKVPQITTNSLGQVTAITEVTITQPTVNNATLTIQKNGTTVNTFTANASSNVTANITVPTTAADVNAVPTTRTVNSKALSSDITLTASDVGAVATANGVTAVVVGSTADKINVTKNGSTSTITVNNVAKATEATTVTTAAATADAERVVFFADSDNTKKLVYDNDFKYNPSTNKLKIENVNANKVSVGGTEQATIQYDSNTESIEFIFL